MKKETIEEAFATLVLTDKDGKQVWPPPIDPAKLLAASKAAEDWVDSIDYVQRYIASEPEPTLAVLLDALASTWKHARTLREAFVYFDAVADASPIRVRDFSSAHKAIVERMFMLNLVLIQLYGLPDSETAERYRELLNTMGDDDVLIRLHELLPSRKGSNVNEAARCYFVNEHPELLDIDPRLKIALQCERAKVLTQVQPQQQAATEPSRKSLADLPDDARMTHLDLADALDVPPEPLRCRLDRWRRNNADGWEEVTERRVRAPKYLYRVGDVREVLQAAIDAARRHSE